MFKHKGIVVFFAVIVSLILSQNLFSQNSQKKSNDKEKSSNIISSKYANKNQKITEYYLHAIYELAQKEDTTSAYRYLEKTYALDSLHAPTLFLIANLSSDFKKATRAAEKAVEIDKENVEYKFFLSSLYNVSKEYGKSIKLLNDIHSKGEYNVNTYRYLTALYDVTGNKDMAIKTIDSAMVKYGGDPDIVSYKGDLLLRDNKTVAYVSNCEDLCRIVPESAIARHKLGMAYSMVGKDSLAYDELQQAYELDPTYLPLLSDLIAYHEHTQSVEIFKYLTGLYKSDEVTFEQKRNYFNEKIRTNYYYNNFPLEISKLINVLRKTYNYNYDVETMYSAHLVATDRDDEALEIQRKFIFDDNVTTENQIAACHTLISAYLYREKKDSVMNYIYIAVNKFQKDPDVLLYASYVLGQCDEHNNSIKLLKNNIKYQKSDSIKSVFYGSIGDSYYTYNDKKNAYKNYKKALKYNPDNIMVLNNFAYYLSLDKTDLEYALEMSERTIIKEPLNGTYTDTYAWILYLLERYDEAKTYQLKAIALTNEDNPELFLHYAEILRALGENLNARRYYRKALNCGGDAEYINEILKTLN